MVWNRENIVWINFRAYLISQEIAFSYNKPVVSQLCGSKFLILLFIASFLLLYKHILRNLSGSICPTSDLKKQNKKTPTLFSVCFWIFRNCLYWFIYQYHSLKNTLLLSSQLICLDSSFGGRGMWNRSWAWLLNSRSVDD